MKNVIEYIVSFFIGIIVGTILIHWKDWESNEWLKLIITTAAGGLITYYWISPFEKRKEIRVIQREHDRDQLDKKEKCTKALLATQMALSLQMADTTR